ncbi:AAA family ATPase [Microbacterium sp. B24]|uniref:AAA family ATPase n=1 Tax=Microbacterium sp. B24 TaxID=95616 RepID=UPI001EF9ED2C|nr:AAA family ATPase [Microbacterium sp. B24]
MKLHRLELTGFGPFRETQVVDFDAFDADGLFLISGRTGTGKSSILDGVSFALYGSVPPYDGGEKRLRSDHADLSDPDEVRLSSPSARDAGA